MKKKTKRRQISILKKRSQDQGVKKSTGERRRGTKKGKKKTANNGKTGRLKEGSTFGPNRKRDRSKRKTERAPSQGGKKIEGCERTFHRGKGSTLKFHENLFWGTIEQLNERRVGVDLVTRTQIKKNWRRKVPPWLGRRIDVKARKGTQHREEPTN